MTAIAIQHREQIIDKVSDGQRLSDIAKGFNVSANAISKALKDDPEYAFAVQEGHASRLDHSEYLIECAVDQVDVARARTLWSAYSWRAERESEKWRAKQQIEITSPLVVLNFGAGAVQHEQVATLEHVAPLIAAPDGKV